MDKIFNDIETEFLENYAPLTRDNINIKMIEGAQRLTEPVGFRDKMIRTLALNLLMVVGVDEDILG